ncbi:hypothetical protein Bpfe_007792 [Biomphalaria pfeifferi]|uniref:Apple domain-containing protein n=1 Tax=Biomphalaria pfeifferi TaxID=112525 RepID=A0AAD8BYT9_BIOPF|nr:hypothetical protein Bpfe_007792 [Biomphalaria pfeifferi]
MTQDHYFVKRMATSTKSFTLLLALSLLIGQENVMAENIGGVTLSSDCFKQAFICLSTQEASQALLYYNAKQYCLALTYNAGSFNSKTCLLDQSTGNTCTEDEYNSIKSQFCGACCLIAGKATLLVTFIVYFFSK